MRRVLGMLVLGAWLALAAIVVTAVPAGASPGGDCVSTERRNVGGTGPAACTCIPSLFERRNVGGTGPADGTCAPLLNFGWQFPRFR